MEQKLIRVTGKPSDAEMQCWFEKGWRIAHISACAMSDISNTYCYVVLERTIVN